MKTKLILALALLALLIPIPAHAGAFGDSGASSTGLDGTPVGIFVYVGSGAAGYVTVTAAGDILLESGDTSTADNTVECDATIAATGARNGTIDVSTTECDTVTEVTQTLNSQTSRWRFIPLAVLGTDSLNGRVTPGNGTLKAVTDQVATWPNGYVVYAETAEFASETAVVAPPQFLKASTYVNQNGTFTNTKPWDQYIGKIASVYEIATYAGGACSISIYAVDQTLTTARYAETTTLLWSEACGATTVAKTLNGWGDLGLYGLRGQKMLVKVQNTTTAFTAMTLNVAGELQQKPF